MTRRGEKEAAIYEAVFRLMEKGVQPHTVTVQQIAEEAGIGKGTIYEYFTSREEILTKAFLYRIEQEAQALAARVDAQADFDAKLESLLRFVREAKHAKTSGMELLFSSARAAGSIEALYSRAGGARGRILQELRALAARIVETGVREGALCAQPGEAYALMALAGSVFGYAKLQCFLPGQSDEALLAEAKRMVYRALGSNCLPQGEKK